MHFIRIQFQSYRDSFKSRAAFRMTNLFALYVIFGPVLNTTMTTALISKIN